MTTIFYSSSNDTLPAYNKNNIGDMITGIKASLITGYKDKPSSGWELLYESISNPSDTSKRIVVRSKAADSEQKVFEITDISNIEGSIKCWDSWSNGAGVNLLTQAKINKNCWGDSIDIIANDKFTHLIVNASYHSFGDIDVFDTSKTKTIVYNMQSTNNDAQKHAIASTYKQNNNHFVCIDGKKIFLRSFATEYLGWGAKTKTGNGNPYYDFYMGGDTNALKTNNLTSVRKAELLQYIDSLNFVEYGFLPCLVYTDNPVTMQGVGVVMDGVDKNLVGITVDGSAMLIFAVDV